MNDANYLQDAWPSLDQAEKRKIVECITNKIVIAINEVEIDLCYLPSSKDMSKRDRSLQGSNPFLTCARPGPSMVQVSDRRTGEVAGIYCPHRSEEHTS